MNQEQVNGLVRTGLVFLGGFLLAKGLVSESTWMEFSGVIAGAVSGIWSFVEKVKNKV